MNTTVSVFIGVTLFTTMLALGLSLRLDALQQWCRRPALPLRVLLGSCVLVPLLGLLLLQTPWSWAVGKPARTAIALMALCPSAPLALRKARQVGGDHQLAALLQVGAALLAIITVPIVGLLFRHTFAVDGWQVRPLDVAAQVAQVQVLPLLLGLGLRTWRPALAERLNPSLNRFANLLLVVLVVLVLIKAGPLLLNFVPSNLLAMGLMVMLSVGSGLIGMALAGRAHDHGLTTAVVTALRNPGLALLFANRHGGGLEGLRLGILLYVLLTVLVSVPLLQRGRMAWR